MKPNNESLSLKTKLPSYVLLTLVLNLSGLFVLTAATQPEQSPNIIIQSVPVPSPFGLTFDGANVWAVSNSQFETGSVTKLRASDGVRLGMFPVGQYPAQDVF